MEAKDYAKENSLPLQEVVNQIRAGIIPGYKLDGVWMVGEKPIYKSGKGEGVIGFVGIVFLVVGVLGGLYVMSEWGAILGWAFFMQGLALYAFFKGMLSIIEMLKFIGERLDN